MNKQIYIYKINIIKINNNINTENTTNKYKNNILINNKNNGKVNKINIKAFIIHNNYNNHYHNNHNKIHNKNNHIQHKIINKNVLQLINNPCKIKFKI